MLLGTTVLNQRRHVGLQKLSALAGITHSFLGPNKKLKFIQDDASGDSALVCSCFRVFENLELSCAVGQLVHDTIKAQQKVYGSGSGCLLFLAGAWSRAALECLQRGVSAAQIISAMSEGMDVCTGVCTRCSISIEDVGVGAEPSSESVTEASQAASSRRKGPTDAGRRTASASGQRRIKLSRHFCGGKSENVAAVLQPKRPDIVLIAEGLSHGSDRAVKLVVDVSSVQSNNSRDNKWPTFDISKVVTCVLPGLPEERACVVPGFIVLLSHQQASVARHLTDQPLRVALITGELSYSYRHLGFRRPAGVTCVSHQAAPSNSSREDEWVEKVVALLLSLEVNVLLVRGVASEEVTQRCCARHILVVEQVTASVFNALPGVTGAVPVTYAAQLSQRCVGTGVEVATWRRLGSRDAKSPAAVHISTRGDSGLVTVVLTSCARGRLQALEDTFWACAHRVHHALKDGALLPGAGLTEMLCARRLQTRARLHAEPGARRNGGEAGAVLELMAQGFTDYISTVMANSGGLSKVTARTVVDRHLHHSGSHVDFAAAFSQLVLRGEDEDRAVSSPRTPGEAAAVTVYDNLSVKQEAWRKALDVVFLVLQTDAEVVTGLDEQTAALGDLTLL